MPRPRVLALIQAGGAGSRMDVLTRERAKPALPFAGVYQLIDFPLSNLAHSGITDVWLSVQFAAATIEEQVANGRPWDLDRTRGGLVVLMPEEGTGAMDEEGFARGNADLLYRVRAKIASFAPDVLLVMSADHVYRLDYNALVDDHLASGAGCTMVTTEVELSDASDHAVVKAFKNGRVHGFAYKPDEPVTNVVAAEIFAYDPAVLISTLEELHRELAAASGGDEVGDSGLGDFGEHLLPRLVDRDEARAYRFDGYWRDVGQPHSYLRAHQDLLIDDEGVFNLPDWPILTQQPQRVPARVIDGAKVTDSMLSPGSRVLGRVERSVLGPGVVVEQGAVVRNSVVFSDCVIEADATVDWAVIDRDCRIGRGARVGRRSAKALDDPDAVILVGRSSTIARGVTVAVGARLEPGSTA